jgi:hypothetical protein
MTEAQDQDFADLQKTPFYMIGYLLSSARNAANGITSMEHLQKDVTYVTTWLDEYFSQGRAAVETVEPVSDGDREDFAQGAEAERVAPAPGTPEPMADEVPSTEHHLSDVRHVPLPEEHDWRPGAGGAPAPATRNPDEHDYRPAGHATGPLDS